MRGVFHCTSASLLTSFYEAEQIPLKAKWSKKDTWSMTKQVKCVCTTMTRCTDGQFNILTRGGRPHILFQKKGKYLFIKELSSLTMILKILFWKAQLDMWKHMKCKESSVPPSVWEIVVRHPWWIDIMVRVWTSDSILLCCVDGAAALSAVSVSSSPCALCSAVVAKHNTLISLNWCRLQLGSLFYAFRLWSVISISSNCM